MHVHMAQRMALTEDIFTVAVGDSSASIPKQEITSFDSMSLNSSLDGGSDVAFTVPGNSATARLINELASDVWVYRNGSIFQRYRIVGVGQTWGPDNDDVVSVQGVCYKRIVNARHLQAPLSFTDTGQADIVAAIYAHTQSQPGGDWGVTDGTLDNDGRFRDRSYALGENIGTILSNLSGVLGGPSWGVSGDLTLEVRSSDPATFPVQGVPLMLGGTARSLTRNAGTGEFANSVFVDGDSSVTYPVTADVANILTDPRGRWERAAGFPNVTEQATLAEKADGLVAQYASPVATWSCEIEASRYLTDAPFSPGDLVTVVVPETVAAPIGNPGFSVTGQVMNLALGFTADGALSVSMEVIETTI